MVDKLSIMIVPLLIIDSILVSTLDNHKALKVTSQYNWQIFFQNTQIFTLLLKIIQDHYYSFSYETSNFPLTLQTHFWKEKNSNHLFICQQEKIPHI